MIRRNILYRLFEALVTIACSILQLSLLTKYFSLEVVGSWALVSTMIFFLSALSANWGIITVAARNAAQGADHRLILWISTAAQAVVSAVMMAILICAVFTLEYFAPIRQPLLFVGSILLLTAIPQSAELLLIARKQMPQIAIAKILGLLVATCLVYLAGRQQDLVIGFLGLALNYIVAAFLTLRFSKPQKHAPLVIPSSPEIILLLKEAAPMVILLLVTWLYVRLDVVIIDYMLGKAAVAQYSVAYGFLDYLMILSGAMMTALFPNFAESASATNSIFRGLYQKTITAYILYFFPVAILIALFAETLLSIFFGHGYIGGASSLRILMLAAVFAWLNGPSGTILISLRRQHVYMIGTCLSLLVNVAGNFLLIPAMGIAGSAWATAFTEVALCTFSLIMIWREIHYLPFLGKLPSGDS